MQVFPLCWLSKVFYGKVLAKAEKDIISRHAVVLREWEKCGSCPRMEWVTNSTRGDQKRVALRETKSALTKGFFFASVTVVIHGVWILTTFSFGLLAKQKQKVVSRTFVSILFILILIQNSQDFPMDLPWSVIWKVVFFSRQNTFPRTMWYHRWDLLCWWVRRWKAMRYVHSLCVGQCKCFMII